jgi:hypothetical protein
MLHITIQKNITCVAFLGWTNTLSSSFIPIILMDLTLLFLYVHQIEYSINSGFILNILENYRLQLNTFLLHHLITGFIIQQTINT